MKTLGYFRVAETEEIVVGKRYYFGQLWDGGGEGTELLESGAISLDEEKVIFFEVSEINKEYLMDTLCLITDIC